jgi:hypothetical protein
MRLLATFPQVSMTVLLSALIWSVCVSPTLLGANSTQTVRAKA